MKEEILSLIDNIEDVEAILVCKLDVYGCNTEKSFIYNKYDDFNIYLESLPSENYDCKIGSFENVLYIKFKNGGYVKSRIVGEYQTYDRYNPDNIETFEEFIKRGWC